MLNKIKLKELALYLDCDFIGNNEISIDGICSAKYSLKSKICILYEEKYFTLIENSISESFFISEKFDYKKYPEKNFIISKKPKEDFIKLLNLFKNEYNFTSGVSNLAHISSSSIIGKNVIINPFVYIGENVTIEEDVTIFSHVFIGDNSFIDKNTIIHPNTSIMMDSKIGKNVFINANVVIGSEGYGFIQDKNNNHTKIPQIGNVIIEDNVEIGAGVCIDRAVIGSTIIKNGSKIDNLVHIAHNVEIGKRNLLIAQSGIAGSTKIGDDCIIAGQSGIGGHLEIGEKTLILAKSGVTKNFSGGKISGFPAREHKEELKNEVLFRKIPEFIEKIKELEIRIKELEKNNYNLDSSS